ncbi:MAG: ParB/RepB/Spo0J family partition protein [Pirellulales bacterium]|nr:ParB/RepB/Spo0J family partition protein [Pirellulales bacterium]
MTKERRLGRGLEALLSRASSASPPVQAPSQGSKRPEGVFPYGVVTDEPNGPENDGEESKPLSESAGEAMAGPDAAAPVPPANPSRLEIRLIDSNPFQPRQDFDETELEELAGSMRNHGLLQPVVVRRIEGRYQLVAGERRLRAATRAGWTEVPVQVVEADDRQMAELAIVENVQRKDLNALEKAASFHRYLQQYGCTQEELAGRLNLDRSTIANLIRLLELPDTVQDSLRRGKLTQGHARALLPLGDEREQVAFCRRIQEEGLSVRQTEALVQETIDTADAEPLSLVGRDGKRTRLDRQGSEHTAALEQEFRAALGLKVKLTHNARGRGKLVIQFAGHEDFDRLRTHICGPAQQAHVG